MSVMALGLGSKGLGWALEFTHLLGPPFPHQRNGTGMGALILFFGTIISIKTPVLIPKFKIGGCYWVFTSVATGHFSVSLKILALVFPEDLGTPDFPSPLNLLLLLPASSPLLQKKLNTRVFYYFSLSPPRPTPTSLELGSLIAQKNREPQG